MVARGFTPALSASPRLHRVVFRRRETIEEAVPDDGPFDAILVNGGISGRPDSLLRQLKDGGRLACLTQGDGAGRAVVYLRSGDAFGLRTIVDATAPDLAEFRPAPTFVF